nr:alpha/beta hydrolase [Nocardioidaceae bacterium]
MTSAETLRGGDVTAGREDTAGVQQCPPPRAELMLREQSRACYPEESGYVEREGVRLFYEVYGTGEPTIVLLPTWSMLHMRHWKMQIAYLARHFRVLTFDGRGSGKSDRPRDPDAYAEREFAADAVAVMDATGTDKVSLVSLSLGAQRALLLAAEHPQRIRGAVFVAPTFSGAASNSRVIRTSGTSGSAVISVWWALVVVTSVLLSGVVG